MKRLRSHPRTYSGLNIADQARSTSAAMGQQYDVVYRHQSRSVHATDAAWLIRGEGDDYTNAWNESPDDVRRIVRLATGLFLCHIGEIIQHFCS